MERRRAAAQAGHDRDADAARTYLADPDGGVRATALGALARAGSVTHHDLRAAIRDTDARVRTRTAQLGATVADVDLMTLLDDADPSVVEMAAWASGERAGTPEAIDALVRIAGSHDDALCREAAVAALGALGDDAGLAAILRATQDKPAIRRRAILALAPFDGPDVDAAMQRALTDRDWQVRQAAEDLS